MCVRVLNETCSTAAPQHVPQPGETTLEALEHVGKSWNDFMKNCWLWFCKICSTFPGTTSTDLSIFGWVETIWTNYPTCWSIINEVYALKKLMDTAEVVWSRSSVLTNQNWGETFKQFKQYVRADFAAWCVIAVTNGETTEPDEPDEPTTLFCA